MRFALSLLAALTLTPAAFTQEKAAFPRRMLFVHIGDYLYLNPLTHSAPGGADRVREAAGNLALNLRVPNAKDNDQLFVLSDTLATDASLPTKGILATSLDRFCATTREQDRVVVYFGVHALEKDGKAFVAPIDGDPSEPSTLLPVADVYAKLKQLKAAQKVVIWDVCRQNPQRVRGRRDPGPMTEELFKSLTTAPEGVQVLVSCSAGEYSREDFAPPGAGSLPGSIFLNALRKAAADDRAANPGAAPPDAIPVGELHKAAVKAVASVVKDQTPASAGRAPRGAVAFDAKAPAAKRFDFPAMPKGAPVDDVKAILDELALPPILEDDGSSRVVARLAFPEAALKDYVGDVSVEEILKDADKYPLRVATLRAFQTLRNTWKLDVKEQKSVHAFTFPITDAMKRSAGIAQEPVAITIIGLELELLRLEEAAGKRANETKRRQAHYDYARAEVRLRLVILNEYNRALGNVRTEAIPDLPAGATGWQLGPAAKFEANRDVKKLFKEATEGFEQILVDHKGTPWAVLAKRSLATLPGARWEAIPPRPETK